MIIVLLFISDAPIPILSFVSESTFLHELLDESYNAMSDIRRNIFSMYIRIVMCDITIFITIRY